MTELYEFHFLNDQLFNLGSVNSVAELQGMLCGRLCAGERLEAAQWNTLALEFMDLEHLALADEQSALLALILERTQALLDDQQLGFTPLLPADETSLDNRARELGAWCEGFLHGLGQAIGQSGLSADTGLSDDVKDSLRDLAHISQAEAISEGDSETEQDEVYWVELVEYVKVAVLNIYNDIVLAKAAKAPPVDEDPNTLH
ncbi:UPF0149 family protein [Teredinibacter turnerae]|uniref:UPF0149 family protein n=1 Tax=Teredinibacter turnerae TaxID=2426 RepID=UPI000370E844|nr:UPF0149 family protein [Teredinibacter turnerae]